MRYHNDSARGFFVFASEVDANPCCPIQSVDILKTIRQQGKTNGIGMKETFQNQNFQLFHALGSL